MVGRRGYFLVDEDEDVPLLPVEPVLPGAAAAHRLPLLPMPLESLPEDPLPRPVDPVF